MTSGGQKQFYVLLISGSYYCVFTTFTVSEMPPDSARRKYMPGVRFSVSRVILACSAGQRWVRIRRPCRSKSAISVSWLFAKGIWILRSWLKGLGDAEREEYYPYLINSPSPRLTAWQPISKQPKSRLQKALKTISPERLPNAWHWASRFHRHNTP